MASQAFLTLGLGARRNQPSRCRDLRTRSDPALDAADRADRRLQKDRGQCLSGHAGMLRADRIFTDGSAELIYAPGEPDHGH